ncbi:hypothetical protein ABZZ36_38145 [Actinacidiphila glaucinigra]|uniref:hypothetical protein n=1 Tax=Actinacidiphila glaucinigra TaxID=235986 RepID=UPI0033BF9647
MGFGGSRLPRRTWAALPPVAGLTGLAALPAGHTAAVVAGVAVLGYLVVLAAVALGAAFARDAGTRRSAACTLDLLLRLIPWYTPRR